MTMLFYMGSILAVLATLLAITAREAVHALMYLVVSLLAAAGVMAALGAPLAAALEVVVYAGAIMVLFVFVVMLLNLGPEQRDRSQPWLQTEVWMGPSLIALALLVVLVAALSSGESTAGAQEVSPKVVGIALFGPYLLAVELGSFLLMAGLVAAYHIGRREELEERKS
jgi:NADH-quinone oxidoreductase subunit J